MCARVIIYTHISYIYINSFNSHNVPLNQDFHSHLEMRKLIIVITDNIINNNSS